MVNIFLSADELVVPVECSLVSYLGVRTTGPVSHQRRLSLSSAGDQEEDEEGFHVSGP